MAVFKVQAPNGKILEIEGPDDATDDELINAARDHFTTVDNSAPKRPKTYETTGEYLTDLGRSALGQGLGLGFGDEIVAGIRSIGGENYDDALKSEREAVDRFRYHNPGTSLAAEIGAGFAIPGLGAAKAIGGAATLAGKAAQGAKYGAGFGATAGFGASEGGFSERAAGAGIGAATGATVGAALPAAATALRPVSNAVGSAIGRATRTIRDDEAAARLYFADRLRQGGVTEADLAGDLQRGQQASQFNARSAAELPETIADTNPIAQRVLRGVKVGGDADDEIIGQLAGRQAGDIDFGRSAGAQGQFGRVYDQLRRALNVSTRSLRSEIDSLTDKRRIEADQRFTAARQNSEAFDLRPVTNMYRMEAQNLPDANQRRILLRAVELFEPEPMARGSFGSAARSQSQRFGTTNIDRFDQARRALGDMMSSQSVREQGNLRRLLTRLMNDAKDAVAGGDRDAPSINAGYFEALQDYATRSELIDAEEIGQALAEGAEELTPALWSTFSRAEQNIMRKAYLERLRGRAGGKTQGPSTDYTDQLRKPAVQQNLRIMLPPRAGVSQQFPGGNRERLGDLVSRERRMTETNQKVLGNSSTAEKAVDAMDVGRMARVARYIRENGGPVQAVVSALSEALEQFGAVKGRRAQYLARKLLSTDPLEQETFLAQVRQTYGAARAQRIESALESTATLVSRSTLPASTTASRLAVEN